MTAIGFLFFAFGLLGFFLVFDERKVEVCQLSMVFGGVWMIVGIAIHLGRVMP